MKDTQAGHRTLRTLLLSIVALGLVGGLHAQVKYHNAGDMHLQIIGGGYFSYEWATPPQSMTWPAGWYERNNLVWYSVDMATSEDVILYITDGDTSWATYGFWPGITQENNNVPISIEKSVRYVPPTVTVDGVVLTPYFEDTHDSNLPADEMIEIEYIMNAESEQGYPGVKITQRSYSFVNQNHDDYVIFDVVFEYTQQKGTDPTQFMPDNPLDAWLAILYGFQPCEYGARTLDMYGYFGGWYEQDDHSTHTVVPSAYSTTRSELAISYAWDGDSPEYPGDDTGDPHPNTGEFLSPQYVGYAFLHVDNAPGDVTDDRSNPQTIAVHSMEDWWWDDEAWSIDVVSAGTFKSNEEILPAPIAIQATKKYHFEKGESVQISYALGAGGLSVEQCKAYGAQWLAGELTDVQKNDLLAGGKDSLIATLDKAAWAFEHDLQVPAAPPSPDLTVTSGPDEILLEWRDVSNDPDPITDQLDFAGYRVYRAIGKRDTTYTQIYEGTPTSFVDTDVVRGVAYYYYVTAFDDGDQNTDGLYPGQSMESSKFLNRTGVAAHPFKSGESTTKEVLVVPNPYDREAAFLNFPGEPDKILFVNLPPICTIRIYTVSGNLIKTIYHDNGSADEAWDLVTAFNQYIASGVYLFRIDDAKLWDGTPINRTSGKFVVIR